jgi:translation initiation factor 2 alpha subunit (eIF-2alpha)
MRVDLVDQTQDLNKSFKEFADKVAENNSKALIEALEGVMRDFNTKINEQFGDNFKQLNQAVGNMLVWQENYKQSVESTEKLLAEIRTSIDTSKSALAEVAVS